MATIKKGMLGENVKAIPLAGIQDALTAATTTYIGPVDNAENTTEDIFFIAPCDGTFVSLYAYLTKAPGGVTTDILTVRKNGSDTSMTCTFSGTATTASTAANHFIVSAGDRITVKSVALAAAVSEDLSLSLGFVPTMRV